MKNNYGYKIGYYRLGKFIAKIVTDSYQTALSALENEVKYEIEKRKWIIKPLTKREYARGVWRDCPF